MRILPADVFSSCDVSPDTIARFPIFSLSSLMVVSPSVCTMMCRDDLEACDPGRRSLVTLWPFMGLVPLLVSRDSIVLYDVVSWSWFGVAAFK